MTVVAFLKEIASSYKRYFLITVLLLQVEVVLMTFVAFSVAPIFDVLMHPDLENVSSTTQKFVGYVEMYGLPANLATFFAIFVILHIIKSVFTILITNFLAKLKYSILNNLLVCSFQDFFKAGWNFFATTSDKDVPVWSFYLLPDEVLSKSHQGAGEDWLCKISNPDAKRMILTEINIRVLESQLLSPSRLL